MAERECRLTAKLVIRVSMKLLLRSVTTSVVLSTIVIGQPIFSSAQQQITPLAEPLTKEDLKPTYMAIVECARRNQEPGCLAARQLADRLLDRPYVTSICKDTAFAVTRHGKTAPKNSFDRKELLVTKANDIMLLCRGKEESKPVSNSLGDGINKR